MFPTSSSRRSRSHHPLVEAVLEAGRGIVSIAATAAAFWAFSFAVTFVTAWLV